MACEGGKVLIRYLQKKWHRLKNHEKFNIMKNFT
jgi:hypothetical protein